MYVTNVGIKRIRSLLGVDWAIDAGSAAGWHVIIGDNGAGKSSILRSIALALIGPDQAMALRQDWNNWITIGYKAGYSLVVCRPDPKHDRFSGRGKVAVRDRLLAAVTLIRGDDGSVRLTSRRQHDKEQRPEVSEPLETAYRSVWGSGTGWFCASFGPFRRFAGGDSDVQRLYFSNPKLARHLSVFGEEVALTEALEWLKQLQFAKLEHRPEGRLLEPLTNFINQVGFLPHHVSLHEITSRGVVFRDSNGCDVPITDLSDGYRSILSMTFELIRQLTTAYGPTQIFDTDDPTTIRVPGVVLIDEADAHLHPTWQRKIGVWFRKHFPKIQFIVTTHSPLICQAADVGTVFKLPSPGTDEKGRFIEGEELDRLIYGNVLDAYSTGVFGNGVTRSEESAKRLDRLAQLNFRELDGTLTPAEQREHEKLRATMPTSANAMPKNGNGCGKRGKGE